MWAPNGHKALVFSQFVDFLTLMRVPLDEAGIAYQYLDGSTTASPGRTGLAMARPKARLRSLSIRQLKTPSVIDQ